MTYLTPEQLAERFGVSRQWVMRRCASGEFAHLRVGNQIRFTPEHIAQIEAAHTVAPVATPTNPWGRKTRRSS